MPRKKKKAVITGIGVISPIGVGIEPYWNNLLSGKTGMGMITLFDASTFPCQVGAEVTEFEPEDFMSAREARSLSRASQFGIAAYELAFRDSGLNSYDIQNADVIVGCAIDSHEPITQEINKTPELLNSYQKVDPLLVQKVFIGGPASGIAARANTEGYVTTVSTACTSGLNALGKAMEQIKSGQSRIVIAGAAEAPITRLIVMGFCASGHFIENNDDPEGCLKPFDLERQKCAPGEGSSIFIIEESEFAKARGARIYCEIENFAQQNENKKFYLPEKSGESWSKAIKKASNGKKIHHINAHGISDKLTDKIEERAIKKGLGTTASKATVTSIKDVIGSGLSSAGAFQMATAAKTVETGIVPKIRNYKTADPDLNLNFVTTSHRQNPKRVLISTHGVTGINGALVFKRFAP